MIAAVGIVSIVMALELKHAPGFLELLLSANVCMRVCLCVCVCVCVSAPEVINN